MAKVDQELHLNSNCVDANRSDHGSSSASAHKPDGLTTRGGMIHYESGAIKKRSPKFLVKKFGIISKASNATPRKNWKLLGKEYIAAASGSKTTAVTNVTASVDLDLDINDKNDLSANLEPPIEFVNASIDYGIEQHRNKGEGPPIQFVTASIGYKTEQQVALERLPPPLDFVVERSPRTLPCVVPNLRLDSLSRSHSSLERSPSGSERFSYSNDSSFRSERSVLSIPETIMSSAHNDCSRDMSLKSDARTSASSLSSLIEWPGQDFGTSLERRGELSIRALSLGEGRNLSGFSNRTGIAASAQSLARSDTPSSAQPLNYSPDDTDSGVEMYHETTSASTGSYSSRRSGSSLSEDWTSEEYSDRSSQYLDRRCKYRSDASSSSYSSRSSLQSQSFESRSPQYSSTSTLRNKTKLSPSTLTSIVSKQLLDSPSRDKRQLGDYYDHRRSDSSVPSSNSSTPRHSDRKNAHSRKTSKVVVLLGKYASRKGDRRETSRCSSGKHSVCYMDDTDVIPLDSITPQEAVAVFHDDVAQMMLEEGKYCSEVNDVDEFLEGYMSLRSPFYLAMVDDFFRAVCVDSYKRPVELPVDGTPRSTCFGSGSVSTSSKSFRSESKSLTQSSKSSSVEPRSMSSEPKSSRSESKSLRSQSRNSYDRER